MNCDPLARWYRTLEHLGMGRALERRRCEFLPGLSAVAPVPIVGQRAPLPMERPEGNGARYPTNRRCRALLLGDGDGRFLAALLDANATVQIDCVDSSAKMLALARERSLRASGKDQVAFRVRFLHADARQWSPPVGTVYDLVVTHFFLDCLTDADLAQLLNRLEPSLACNAVWLVSEFHQPSGGLRAWRAKLWIGGLYLAFGWLTGLRVRRLPDHRRALTSHQFTLEQAVQAEWGLLVSEWWRRSL